MNTFGLTATYLLLHDTRVDQLDGGDTFWAALDNKGHIDRRIGEGWLVGIYPMSSSWPTWEMRSDRNEVIYAVHGRMVLVIDRHQPPARRTLRRCNRDRACRGVAHHGRH
jgi:hypothetical protein